MMENYPKPPFASSPTALHLMGLVILGYGWQVHGLWVAISFCIGFYIAVLALNYVAILAFKSLRLTTALRIVAFVIFIAVIAISGGQICDAVANCRSLT